MSRVSVGTAADLGPGDRKVVRVDDVPVLVLNVGGEYYALENTCRHQGGPVGQGKVMGRLEAEFVGTGERIAESFSETEFTISCPWHGWEYDLRTGTHCGDADVALRTFEVVEENGELFVEP